MRLRKLLKPLLVLLCAGLYGYSAVVPESSAVINIGIDVVRPLSIVWPFELAVVGDLGEKGLRIAPNIGRGWRGEAGGQAGYKFYAPDAGTYYIWAYCLWFDECANAVFVQIDDLDKAIFGNDPVYEQWHWVRGFTVHLEKGTHTLVLSNHSDHIAIQKVLFSNSGSISPENCGPVFSDIFYDGFDGCDRGNFADWLIVSGKWQVQDPAQQACFIENALVGTSQDTSFVIYRADDWHSYSLNVAVRCGPWLDTNASVGVCFGVRSETEYYQLQARPIKNTGNVKMQLLRRNAQAQETLTVFEVPWDPQRWHQVSICLDAANITLKVDDAQPVKTSVDYEISGGIGLRLQGEVTAYFDDIHVRETVQKAL